MNFLVLSQTKAKKFSCEKSETPFIVISITDKGEENVVFHKNPQLQAILRLDFDDVEGGKTSITQEDAKKIVDFVECYKEVVQLVVVHCGAVCRVVQAFVQL